MAEPYGRKPIRPLGAGRAGSGPEPRAKQPPGLRPVGARVGLRARTGDGDGWLEALFLLALSFCILSFLLHETYELDVWWQVATGRDILATWRVPHTDLYRVAALGEPYHDAHWLFQILLALAERPFGMAGVQLVTLGFWIPTLVLVFRSARGWLPAPAAGCLVFLAALASVERFLPRPEIVTYLGIAVFLHLLQERRYRSPPQLGLLFLVQLAWTNAHGMFCVGPFLVGCYWLWAVARRWAGRESDLRPLSRALCVVLLATLASPYGLGAWRYAFLILTQVHGGWAPAVFQNLGELSPTFGEAFRSSPAFWAFLALLVPTGPLLLAALSRSRVPVPRALAAAGLLAAACTGRRNVVLFALPGALLLAECAALVLPPRWLQLRRAWAALPAALLLAVAWFPLSGRYYTTLGLPTRAGWGVTPSYFPHELPAFLDRIDFRGNVVNSNVLGGFYLYHGFPDRLPLTDGMWTSLPPKRLEWIIGSTHDALAWRTVADHYRARGLLLAHASPEGAVIVPTLVEARDWRLVYLDAAASFWMRADDPDAPPAIDPTDPGVLPRIARVEDGVFLELFLSRVRATAARAAVLEQVVGFDVRQSFYLSRLGVVLTDLGRRAEAREAFERALRRDEESVGALYGLARLAWQDRDLEGSLRLLERALRVEPGHPDVQRTYDWLQRRHHRLLIPERDSGPAPGEGVVP